MGVTRGSLNLPRYPDLSGGPLPEERGYGVMVGGVPIGDAYYVHESLRSTAAGVVSYIETTVTQLRDSPHACSVLCSVLQLRVSL